MKYFCCTDTRRSAVRLHPTLNGIDFLEVSDNPSDPNAVRQTILFVHFIKPVLPGSLQVSNLKIEGGERIKNIAITGIHPDAETSSFLSPPDGPENVLTVSVSKAGDFSTYTLRLVQDSRHSEPPAGFDPVLSSVDFSFKVACPSDFDCKPVHQCPTEPVAPPEINYLAKDYASFRQLMLDRMALLVPEWKDRNPADMSIALVELLAYVGDYLSYRQDAVATEAYLGTARKRISVRRHARLVDYFMHDGCNARTWLHIQVGPDVAGLKLEKGEGADVTKIVTKVSGLPPAFALSGPAYEKAVDNGATVFEMMHDITLYTEHNKMNFYTWCGNECCLPKGATQATLAGSFPNLKRGDVLILAEVLGAETGKPHDANPAHRHAVRLTEVTLAYDLLCGGVPGSPPLSSPPVSSPPVDSPPVSSPPDSPVLGSPPDGYSVGITEIKWEKADALPFPLCISNHEGTENISVALGNNVLVDHGRTIMDIQKSSLQPDEVLQTGLVYAKSKGGSFCVHKPATAVPLRFRPKLLEQPLTFAAPFIPGPAKTALAYAANVAMPAIKLTETGEEGDLKGNPVWEPKRDLLNSASSKKEFVVETESDGTAYIRFGDNKQGARPAAETKFMATYRIGNGVYGNVGAGSLAHIATADAAFIASMQEDAAVWNPLPATGGTERETIEEVRQFAPVAFRTQKRAVTAHDYETFAKQCDPGVQRAAATFRWTGSWKTVFLSVDRLEGADVDMGFEKSLRGCLEEYRMAGFDLEVDDPLYVSLEIEMVICVNPKFFAGDVKKALLELFGSGYLPDGRKGVFHPDNFSFGQTVYLSPIYAAAQAVQGVDSVQITKFQRQGRATNEALQSGKLLLNRREIARLANDRNFPERGVFNVIAKGGRS
jgi:hypothetical protein